MALWQAWTDLLQGILQTLSVDWRLGGGLAIIIPEPQLKLIREVCALALRRVLTARAGGSLA